jgi:hypothetical protein
MRPAPIRIGDKFNYGSGIWEVITLRGARIELFEREQCCFVDSNYHNVRSWRRIV